MPQARGASTRAPSMSGRAAPPRVLAGLVAGAATTVAPFLYYWALEWQPLETTALPYFCLLLCPVVAGGLVTMLVASARPRWWLGAALGLVLGAVAAGFYFRGAGDVPKEWWLQLLLSVGFAALGGLAGGVGGLLGWVVSGSLSRAYPGSSGRKMNWVAGVVVATVAVVACGILAVLARA
jgi:hypothetical protein